MSSNFVLKIEIFKYSSYSGLIWQCADMNHEEYKNKYEELNWLMVKS